MDALHALADKVFNKESTFHNIATFHTIIPIPPSVLLLLYVGMVV